MQVYKGDPTELLFIAVHNVVGGNLLIQKDAFYNDAFNCEQLGGLLYDNKMAPLSNAIPREIFIQSFSTIFQQFLEAGSAESYLYVFRKIFGDDVDVQFTIPAPGKLQIDIEAQGVEHSLFIARRIENNDYVREPVIDQDGNNLVFQSIKGFQTQYELEQMLFEMVPAGIYTEITLELGA